MPSNADSRNLVLDATLMTDTTHEELQHFVKKWFLREPEMLFAEVFCPVADKPLFLAWGAFQNEIRHTLFELSDARVTEVKTAWWAEECGRIATQQSRHPISQVIQSCEADWLKLASMMLHFMSDANIRASTTDEAIAQLMPLASAMQSVEAKLFNTNIDGKAAKSIAISWLWQRLPQGLHMEDQARIPMHLFARHHVNRLGLAQINKDHALLRDWAQELLQQLPGRLPNASLLRKTRLRFDHARLSIIAQGKGFNAPSAIKNLWRAWKGARS